MYLIHYFIRNIVHFYDQVRCCFYIQTYLRIPITRHTAIIDISRSTDKIFIINNHQLWMKVDNLSDGFLLYDAVGSEAEELYVLEWIIGYLLQSWYEAVLTFAYCLVLPVHDYSWECGVGVVELSSKSRYQGHKYNNLEFLLFRNSSGNPLVQTIHNLIFHGTIRIPCRNKELILYVDKFLWQIYQGDIGIVDGLLRTTLLAPDWPLWSWS